MEQAELRNTEKELIATAVFQDSFASDVTLSMTNATVRNIITTREQNAKRLGWDTAHEWLCGKTQCRSHTNPWIRSRA